jgi:mono/diheme cytochrome c family protein
VPKFRAVGYLASGLWTRAYLAEHYPQTIVGGRLDRSALPTLPHQDRIAIGQVLFQYHCNDCHAATDGYSAAGSLLRGRSRETVRLMIEHLEDVLFMPSWAGTAEEADLLTDYLFSITPRRPEGMRVEVK